MWRYLGGHGCHCSHVWKEDAGIASFQLFIVVPKHFDFVPAGCDGGIKLLQHVTLLKFKHFFWICEDVTWPTSVGSSWSVWAACPGSLVIVDRQVLAEVLKENRTLKRLNLAYNDIGVTGVEAFAGGLGRRNWLGTVLVQFAYSSCLGRRLCNDGGS